MTSLEKRIDRLELVSNVQHQNIKLLMHNEGEPQPVIPNDGQHYRVVTFVSPKHWEPDHDET